MAVAVGYARVFAGWSFLADMAVIVVVGHGSGLVLRTAAADGMAGGAGDGAATRAGPCSRVYFPDTFSWGLPTSETWTILGDQLALVRAEFRTAVAPVDYGGGWDVLAAIGLAMAVLLADVFAFRAAARAETLVPGGVLFVFVGALGDERFRVVTAVVLVGVGVATTATLRALSRRGRPRSLGSLATLTDGAGVRRWSSRWPPGRGASAAGRRRCAALRDERWRRRRHPGAQPARRHPFAIDQPLDDELFRVRADVESYWRSSALPEFDGTTWGLPERELQPVDGPLDRAGRSRSSRTANGSRSARSAARWCRLPPIPFEASGPDDLRFVAETSTLVTVDERPPDRRHDRHRLGRTRPRPARLSCRDVRRRHRTRSTPACPPTYPTWSRRPHARSPPARRARYEAALRAAGMVPDASSSTASRCGPATATRRSRASCATASATASSSPAPTPPCCAPLGIPTRVAVGFTSGVPLGDGEYSVLGTQRTRLAGGVVRRHRMGRVRADARARRTERRELHRCPPAAGHLGGRRRHRRGRRRPDDHGPSDPPGRRGRLEHPRLHRPDDGRADGPAAEPESDSNATALWLALFAVLGAALVAPGARPSRPPPSPRLDRSTSNSPTHGSERPAPCRRSACRCSRRTPRAKWRPCTAQHFPLVARPMESLADAVTEATYRADGTAGFDVAGTYGASTISSCRNWAKQIDRAASESLEWPDRVRRYFTTWR